MVKKQKLEILKEGGLEVTPVGTNAGGVSSSTSGSVSSSSTSSVGSTSSVSNPVSNGPHPPPRQLLPPARQSLPAKLPPTNGRHQPESPYKANGADKMSITVTPDISHLLCPPGPSKRAIYSNPKEVSICFAFTLHSLITFSCTRPCASCSLPLIEPDILCRCSPLRCSLSSPNGPAILRFWTFGQNRGSTLAPTWK